MRVALFRFNRGSLPVVSGISVEIKETEDGYTLSKLQKTENNSGRGYFHGNLSRDTKTHGGLSDRWGYCVWWRRYHCEKHLDRICFRWECHSFRAGRLHDSEVRRLKINFFNRGICVCAHWHKLDMRKSVRRNERKEWILKIIIRIERSLSGETIHGSCLYRCLGGNCFDGFPIF